MTHPVVERNGFAFSERDVSPDDQLAGVVQRWVILPTHDRSPILSFVRRLKTDSGTTLACSCGCPFPCAHIHAVEGREQDAA